jgi:hypothetical protein
MAAFVLQLAAVTEALWLGKPKIHLLPGPLQRTLANHHPTTSILFIDSVQKLNHLKVLYELKHGFVEILIIQ